jgi:hypothetical protein
MKSLNMKLVLSAIAIAMLATPALAKSRTSAQQSQDYQDYYPGFVPDSGVAQDPGLHYPNGALRGGAAEDYQSGAEFNLGR